MWILPLKEWGAAPVIGKEKRGKEVDLSRRKPQKLGLLLHRVSEHWEGRDCFWKRMLTRVAATLCTSSTSTHPFPSIWHNQSRQWGHDCFLLFYRQYPALPMTLAGSPAGIWPLVCIRLGQSGQLSFFPVVLLRNDWGKKQNKKKAIEELWILKKIK